MGPMEGTRWEGMDLIFAQVLVRHLLGPLSFSRPMTSTSWTHSYSNSPIGRYNPPPAAHLPPPPTHLLIHSIRDITIIVKMVFKSSSVS